MTRLSIIWPVVSDVFWAGKSIAAKPARQLASETHASALPSLRRPLPGRRHWKFRLVERQFVAPL